MSKDATQKKKQSMHPFVIIVLILLVAAVVSNFLPAGEYQRVAGPDGRTIVDPTTFQFISRDGFNLMNILTAIPRFLPKII